MSVHQDGKLMFVFFVFRRHMTSDFVGKALNRGDALRNLPSVCTTAVTTATDFMQVLCVCPNRNGLEVCGAYDLLSFRSQLVALLNPGTIYFK